MRSFYSLVLVLVVSCVGQDPRVPRHPSQALRAPRFRRGSEQDFWSGQSLNYNSGSLEAGYPIMDIPVNDVPLQSGRDLDKIQVFSTAIRVLPRNKVRSKRQVDLRRPQVDPPEDNSLRRKREAVQSWRKPRQHQFVTKADRLPPPPIVRVYPPVDRTQRYDRDYRKGQRRIIYYANLPEIVRPPVQWYNTRGEYYDTSRQTYPSPSPSYTSPSYTSPPYSSSHYPSPSDNEITRVQSNVIDVVNSRYNSYASTPKFTIIDVDPPYNYPSYNRQPPVRYDLYPSTRYNPNRFYNDVRTPPYRDPSRFPEHTYRPESSLEPVKLQIPTTDRPSTTNSTELQVNTTRYLPDPVSLRSLSKFVT